MGAGRPPDGLQHVQRLSGRREEKKRMRWIFAAMMNECTVQEACEALGIRPARFHQLRSKALEGALLGLSPGERGRPRKRKEDEEIASKVQNLERKVKQLQLEVYTARLREDLQSLSPPVSQKNRHKRK